MDSGATGILLMTYVPEFTGLKTGVNLSSPIRYVHGQSHLTSKGCGEDEGFCGKDKGFCGEDKEN